MGTAHGTHEVGSDINLVEHWLRVDPFRLLSGALAGAFAGLMALVVAGIVASATGYEFLFPVKLMGAVILGSQATEAGMNVPAVMAGLLLVELIAMFWGIIYSHFVFTNALPALLGMGLVWTYFSWVFTWNLFLQSFPPIKYAAIPAAAAIPVCLVYGLSMTSVAFFDRLIRGHR